MKKKFTMLLATYLTFVGVAMAGVTDLPQMSKEGDIKWYTIRNTRSDKYANYAGDDTKMTQVSTPTLSSLFYFTTSDAVTAEGFTPVMIHNAATTKKLADFESWTESGIAWYLSVDVQNETALGLHITKSAAATEWGPTFDYQNALNAEGTTAITYYCAKDAGSVFVIEAVDITEVIAAYKTNAINALKTLGTAVDFTATESAINALTVDGENYGKYLADIDAVVNGATQYVAFRNGETDTNSVRYNNYLGVDMLKSKGKGIKTFDQLSAVWSLKYTGNGSFYIYNVNNNVYLSSPESRGTLTEMPDAAYTFELIEDDKVEIKFGTQTLHMNNHDGNGTVSLGNNALTNYDSDDVASRWYVVTDFTFVVDIESLKENAIGELTELAKLSFIYSTAEQAKAEINNLNPAKNNLKELQDAAEKIETIVEKCKTDAYQALNEKYFTIYTPARQNGYMQMTVSKVVGTASVSGPANIWQFIYNDNGAYYIYNPYIGQYLCEPNENSQIVSVTNDQSNASAYTFVISTTDNDNDGAVVKLTSNDKSVHMDGSFNLVRWDDGAASEWSIAEFGLEDFKEVVTAEIDELLKLSAIYPDATHIKTEIQNTVNSNIIEGCLAINNILENFRKIIDGKSMKFRVDGRGSRFLGYSKTNDRIETQVLGFDDAYWTLKYVGNGYFKLYNPVHKVWLGAPSSKWDEKEVEKVVEKEDDAGNKTTETVKETVKENYRTPGLANEADASLYKLEVKGDNVVLLVTENGKVAHANSGHVITDYWYKEDHASWWTIIDAGTFSMTYDEYKEFLTEKSKIMNNLIVYAKQLQDEYGLVKKGDKIAVVVNHPSGADSQPSSNLLDGNNGTYVHSSYDGNTMNTEENHYIEVELSEATQNIFCYFSKRNDNNRPAVIKVYAGNSAEEITTLVGTLNMPESYDNSVQAYFSEGIDLGAEYSHLRFVVTQTNTGTKFFTLSEFYVLPINDDTRNIAELTSASITDINTSERIENAQGYLNMLKNASDFPEVKKLLDDNKANHAATPQLGQYPTEAYNALKDALKSADATEESLNEAVAVFKASKNMPVFTISNGDVKDYAKGKSIYDNNSGTLYFKTTNLYDKTMWWALDQVETTVSVTGDNYVGIYNVGTGNGFWNAASIKVTETNENEGAGISDDNLFLIYKKGGYYPAHFQQYGSEIVEYWSYEATSGSAAKFTYIGNTYDLNKLTDEYFTAASALATVNVPAFEFGTDVNKYNEATQPALDVAIANRTTVLSKLSTIEEIADAKTKLEEAVADVEINIPKSGHYYRIRCADKENGMKRLQSTIIEGGDRLELKAGDDGINDGSIFYYTEGGLMSYTEKKFIDAYRFVEGGDVPPVKFSAATNGAVGRYNIKIGDRFIFGAGNYIDSDSSTDERDGYTWWLEPADDVVVNNYKAAAKTALDMLTFLGVDDEKTAIDDVEVNSNAFETIDAIVNGVAEYVAFRNAETNTTSVRYNNYLGVDMVNSKGNGHATFNHLSDVWSLKYTGQGSFYIYNVNNKVYLGNPESRGTLTEMPDAAYIFELIEENKVEIKSGTQTLHMNNHNGEGTVSSGNALTNYDYDDVASRWYVETDFPSHVEAYKTSQTRVLESLSGVCALVGVSESLATAKTAIDAIATTDYATFAAIDAEVGKVTDAIAAKDVVFQNSNTTDPNRSEVYLATDMSDNKGRGNKEFDYNAVWSLRHVGGAAFYLYNGLHKVYLGDPNGAGALTAAPVASYTFEIVDAEKNLVELHSGNQTLHVHNWDDCTLTNYDHDADASRWYVSTIDVTAEIQELIVANEDNHAETPELGQYTTAGYEALVAAKSTVKTVEEVDAAIVAFKATLNRPVYFITSMHDGYAAGSAIYFDGAAWKWKAANIFDKQMWMAIPGYTEENVPVVEAYDAKGTSYEICDYLTSTVMRGKKVQIVAVEGWEGAYSLQYNADATSTDAAQHAQSGGALVNWKPALANDCKASAWHVEYIGNSYDLDQLTDEYFADAAELAAVTVPNFEFSEKMNQYDPNTKPALDEAIANRTTVLSKFSTAKDIAAAKSLLETAIAGVQLNMPENGKFYRVRCAGDGMKRLQSTINNGRLQMIDGVAGINASSIFCYVNGSLLSYTTGQYINAYKFDAVGTNSTVTFSKAYNGALGQYNININDRYIYGKKNEIDSGTGNPTDNGYNWWLEEVTTLPVSITAVGYTTFYTPIAVTIPEDLEAYIVSETNSASATLEQVTGIVPAQTGLIIRGNQGAYNFEIAKDGDAQEITSNLLEGTNAKTIITPDNDVTCYVLSKPEAQAGEEENPVGFYKMSLTRNESGTVVDKDATSFINGANKVYLPVNTSNGQGAPSLMFRFGTTEVEHVDAVQEAETRIYDLMGRRVEKMEKGLYIVNGKKVLVK